VHIVDITMFYAAEAGGVRTYLTAKAEWLMRHTRIRHTVVGPREQQCDRLASFIGVPSAHIPWGNGFRMPLSIRRAAGVLRRLEPDLIEVGDPFTFAWAALRVRRNTKVPVVGYYHSDLMQIVRQRLGEMPRDVVARYIGWLYRRFDLVFAPSRLMVARLKEVGVERVRHQPLGVDTDIFSPDRRDPTLRARLGLPRHARLLVYAGRFTREKKLHVLVDAVQRLGEPYYLLMVGNGTDIPHSPRIIRLPFQRDPRALAGIIASCDALVHPGDQETFGLIVLEAMACGVPVVGVAAGGVGEMVDRDSGLLVRPGSATALADGIADIYGCDRERMGANGRRRTVGNCDWRLIVPQLVAQYAGLLAARERAELEAGLAYAAK
jgi:alpha-1,6-mannosyltransferase